MNQEIREQYKKELEASWDNRPSMVEYCLKQAQMVVRTSKGYLISISKPHIKKDFCYGESGYDFDDAVAAAQHIRTNEQAFIMANLEDIDEMLSNLQSFSEYTAYAQVRYDGRNNAIRTLALVRPGWLYSYPWKWEADQGRLEELPEEDRQLLIDAYLKVRQDFIKRLHAYLKRYGLSKVNSWTYWRDA